VTEWTVIPSRKGIRPDSSARVSFSWRRNTRRGATDALPHGHVTVSAKIVRRLDWREGMKLEIAHDAAGGALRIRPAAEGYALRFKSGCVCLPVYLDWVKPAHRAAEVVQHSTDGDVLFAPLPAWARKPAGGEGTSHDVTPAQAVAAAPPAARGKTTLSDRWTEARKAELQRLYPTAAQVQQICGALNLLPGPPITPQQAMGYASLMGLKRPATPSGTPVGRPPKGAIIGTGIGYGAKPPDNRDELEAKVELRKGTSARAVAEEFGIRLAIVSRWLEEVRAEKPGSKAA
jgi:hypothetical protein